MYLNSVCAAVSSSCNLPNTLLSTANRDPSPDCISSSPSVKP